MGGRAPSANQARSTECEVDRFEAVRLQPVHLGAEVGRLDEQFGVGLAGRELVDGVVAEDRHRAGVGTPVGLGRGVAGLVCAPLSTGPPGLDVVACGPIRDAVDRPDAHPVHPDRFVRVAAKHQHGGHRCDCKQGGCRDESRCVAPGHSP